ncbi:hypothetical protein FOA43_002527 [Brettanomyces nanus]|uniref:NAD(P)-binding domain-containing protein n=1 Tax=Eeniella nana TaxID=13502 RepID=A0A875S2J8_EENNA|nr:uncharacterized protein FOA43_002527 [Brettanomyces nanus]QPG75178.1 hypothetical protein FOA43_002527 [Brettanomyces nanus]
MTIAFFGATGGCANACLTYSLKNNFKCRALARNPEKLRSMLEEQGLDQTSIDSNLTIVEGSIEDVNSIVSTIKDATHVVSGVGSTPKLQMSLTTPVTIVNPTVCEAFANNLTEAVHRIGASEPPSLAVVSTTGISSGPEDVPFGLRWLYHIALKTPHADKRKMEKTVKSTSIFSRVVVVRASLLKGTHLISSGDDDIDKVLRVGTEKQPEVGYAVKRANVGRWIYERFIKSDEIPKGHSVYTLTE